MGVRALNDGAGRMTAALGDDFDVQLVAAVLFELDVDAVLADVLLALFQGLRGDVLEYLKLVVALADEGT